MLIDKDGNNVPRDWNTPLWDVDCHLYNWHNYVDDEVKCLWNHFTDEMKQALAQNFQGIADNEYWD